MEHFDIADSESLSSHHLLGSDVSVSPRKQNVTSRSRQAYTTGADQNWPPGPSRVHRSVISLIFSLFVDIVLILIALLFSCLAIVALYMKDQQRGTPVGTGLQEAMKLGPTIYPIVFAAIVGRALKSMGRYQAEKGVRLSVLWPIMNTKTIFDAVLSQWSLRRLSFTASLLGILWILSPIGGQASLRVVYNSTITQTTPQDLRYMDTGPLGHVFTMVGVISSNDLLPKASGLPSSMSATYSAALMQGVDTKASPRDAWGNPKIPNLDRLGPSLANSSGWIEISNTTTQVETWNSLLGLPIAGLQSDGITEFTVETSYVVFATPSMIPVLSESSYGLSVSCPDCINTVVDDDSNNRTRELEFLGSPLTELINKTEPTSDFYTDAQTIVFTQQADKVATKVIGQVTQRHVETAIQCNSGNCYATAIRQSTTDDRPANLTTFDYWGTFALDMITFNSQFNSSATSSPSELFILNSSNIPVVTGNDGDESFSATDMEDFGQRATMLLNTAIQIFLSPVGFAGNLPSSNLSLYGLPHNPANGLSISVAASNINLSQSNAYTVDLRLDLPNMDVAFVGASTTANVTTSTDVYKPSYIWVILLLSSSIILATTGLAGILVNIAIKAPDVFDPVIGLTYGNPYLKLPSEGSILNATDRARMLGTLKVRLGDVKGVDSVGKIALGKMGEVRPISKGKEYE